MVAKYIWDVAHKEHNMCVKWVHEHFYLKEVSLWENIPAVGSCLLEADV